MLRRAISLDPALRGMRLADLKVMSDPFPYALAEQEHKNQVLLSEKAEIVKNVTFS